MPRLLAGYKSIRLAARPDTAAMPGGGRFDPWCLTDRVTLPRWKVVTDATLTATVSAKGDLRAYVLSLPGNPAPGKVGADGPYLR